MSNHIVKYSDFDEKDIILLNIRELDKKIWKHFYPDAKQENEPELYQAVLWLNTDVSDIMVNFPGSKEEILAIIKESPHGDIIIRDYLEMDRIEKEVAIRSDFATALKSVKKGSQLSCPLDWGLSKRDLKELAKLHKANRFRKKIEDLLEDCNFHYECGKFSQKEYNEFLT